MTRNRIAAGMTMMLISGLMMMLTLPAAGAAASTGTIRGTVTTTTGTPLSGVMVSAYGTGGGNAKTNASGVYEITGLQAGTNYVVSFNPPDGSRVLGSFYGGGGDWQSTPRVTVTAGVTTTGIDQSLAAGATISGRVLDESGHGLAGVFVNATNYTYYFQYQPYLGVEGFVTDANGYYSVYGLPTGSYRVQFVAPANSNLMSVYYGGGRDYLSSTVVKTTAGADSPLNVVTLHPGATVAGVVSGPDGPVAGAQVVVGPTMSSKLRRSALTGADGSYSISGVLTDTDVVVGFYAPPTGSNSSLRTEFWNDASSEDAATKLRLRSGKTQSGISPVLSRRSGISGVVSGPDGPARGVSVYAVKLCAGGDYSSSSCFRGVRAVTADDGSYLLSLEPGTWRVSFDPSNGPSSDLLGQIWMGRPLNVASSMQSVSSVSADLVTLADGQMIPNVNPVLERGGTITGTLTRNGSPVAGVYVVAASDAPTPGLPGSAELAYAPHASSASDGSFRITGLKPGNYRVGFLNESDVFDYNLSASTVVASEWYNNKAARTLAESISVSSGAVIVANADLDAPGSISGTINDSCGSPKVTATESTSPFRSRSVQLYFPAGTATPFTVSGLSPGSYFVRVDGCDTVHWYPGATSSQQGASRITVTSGGDVTGITLVARPVYMTGATSPPAPSNPPAIVDISADSVTVSPLIETLSDPNGGSVVTGYLVTSIPEGRTCSMGRYGPSCTVSGLTSGAGYQFVLQAINSIGTGPMSRPSNIAVIGSPVQPTIPGAPRSVAVGASSGKAALSWRAPVSDGGAAIVGYNVMASPGGQTCSTNGSLSCTVSGLSNGTAYTFSVTATNSVGTGQAATSSAVTPSAVPDAPVGAVAAAGPTSATVRWSAPPSNGGSAITSYQVTSTPGSKTCSTAGLTCTVTGLTNGTTYTFRVTARNVTGTGPAAVSTPATPQLAFAAPSGVTAIAGNRVVSVAWVAPAATGGSTITGYVVTATAIGRACWTSEQSGCIPSASSGVSSPEIRTCSTVDLHCDMTGLWNGVTYSISVKALTASRTGPSSAFVTAIPRPDPPSAPTGVSAFASTGSATVTWSASSADGDSRIVGYTVTSTPDGRTCSWTTGELSCIVSGLTNGTAYTFTVKATNATGDSVASAPSAPVTPKGAPGSPSSVSGTAADRSVAVSWSAPATNGGSTITSYVVTSTPDGRSCTWSSGPLTCTVTGLANGTSYVFTAVAINSFGSGSISAASSSVVPRALPGAPTAVIASAGNGAVTVSWSAPVSNGGAVISKYTVTSSPGGKTCTWSSGPLSCTVTGLTNGTSYTFTVVATNAAGNGAVSSASSSVSPRTVPGAPRSVTGVAGNGSVTVSWSAPLSNGGAVITKYTVTSSPGGKTCTWTTGSLSCKVIGLTNGINYTFTVKATNAAGVGLASSASAFIKPHV